MFCENCGAQIQDDSKFCESCGAIVESGTDQEAPDENEQPPEENKEAEEPAEKNEEKRCSTCGAILDPDARFCDHCGEAVLEPEPEPTPEPKPKEEPEPIEPPTEKTFCMACGKELAAGAAFCDACGTPTGQVPAPPSQEPALIGTLISKFFKCPAETIKLAADKNGVTAGILFYVIKDAILAVLTALLISKISESLGMFSMFITSEDTFLMAIKVFFAGVVMDALWVAILYGGGRVFQGDASSWSAVIGAAGTSSIALTAALLVTAIAAAIAPSIMICALLMTAGVLITTSVIVLEQVMGVSKDMLVYAIPTVVIVHALVIYGIIYIIINNSTSGYGYL